MKKCIKTIKDAGVAYVCVECGITDIWNNKPITLHVDHLDGNNRNDDISNLRYLCPNCHSQTTTYCGRNISKKPKSETWKAVQDEVIIEAIKASKNISEVICRLNLDSRNNLFRNKIKQLMLKTGETFNSNAQNKINEKIAILKNSNVNFSRFGWVNEAAKILEIKPQKVSSWMKKHMTDFYFTECYIRRLYVYSDII